MAVRRTGRKTKFTKDTVDKLVEAISMGASYDIACKYAGISFQSFNQWRNGKGFPQSATEADKSWFFEQIDAAEARVAMYWLGIINAAAKNGTWQAAAWGMERRFPLTYGRNIVEVTGKDGGPVRHDLRAIPDRAIDAAMEAMVSEAEEDVKALGDGEA